MSEIPAAPTAPYTQAQRRSLLDEYFSLLPDIADPERGDERYDRALARLSTLWDAYVAGTPYVPLSRCPFTQQVFRPSLDPYGLDGLFWKFDAAARRSEPMRGSLFAFTGALRLGDPVEAAPFLVRPGPEAPFVVPRILHHDAIRAVLSSVPIGRHTAYAIIYFSQHPVMDLERFNTWGLDDYSLEIDTDEYGWNSSTPMLQDYDFELAPWIQQGKLHWIAPGDESLTIREGLAGCPYLNLAGRRLPLCIQDGEVWTAALWVPPEDEAPANPTPAPPPTPKSTPTPLPPRSVPAVPPAKSAPSVPPPQSAPAVPPPQSAPSVPPPAAQKPVRSTVACPQCGTQNGPDAKFCRDCGSPLQAAKTAAPAPATCANCGRPLKPGAKFCGTCGTRQN